LKQLILARHSQFFLTGLKVYNLFNETSISWVVKFDQTVKSIKAFTISQPLVCFIIHQIDKDTFVSVQQSSEIQCNRLAWYSISFVGNFNVHFTVNTQNFTCSGDKIVRVLLCMNFVPCSNYIGSMREQIKSSLWITKEIIFCVTTWFSNGLIEVTVATHNRSKNCHFFDSSLENMFVTIIFNKMGVMLDWKGDLLKM
jgi:hypothetical protein